MFLAVGLAASMVTRGSGFFDDQPILYSLAEPRDPVAMMEREWERGENLIEETTPLGFLRALLARLNVPEESQVLVFSKTSHQNPLISPQTPRALYFSDDTSPYLRPTSDIVALMVLEHQCRMHNLLTKASMEYRRALWVTRVVQPDLDEAATDHVAHRVAESSARAILREMLFVNEAEPGPFGVDGDPAFQEAFRRGAPADPSGRTLRDFRLSGRLFTHRCSYMIHSRAFAALPDKVRGLVYAGLREIFLDGGGGEEFKSISQRERQRITEILNATHPQWRE